MTRVVKGVPEIAKAVLKFDMNDDHSSIGFQNIVAVGVLVCLLVSFLPILGFKELPQFVGLENFPFRQYPSTYLVTYRNLLAHRYLRAVYRPRWRSKYANFIHQARSPYSPKALGLSQGKLSQVFGQFHSSLI